jgi:hypothetical protein
MRGKITTCYKGNMLFESRAGNHSMFIDVPAAMGGSCLTMRGGIIASPLASLKIQCP